MEKELKPKSFGFKMIEPARQELLETSEKNDLPKDMEEQALEILDTLKTNLDRVKNPELFEKSRIYAEVPEEDFCMIEWVNGWGRVQFLLGPSNDIVFMDNHEKKTVPDIEVYLMEEEDLQNMIVKAIKFIPRFNDV